MQLACDTCSQKRYFVCVAEPRAPGFCRDAHAVWEKWPGWGTSAPVEKPGLCHLSAEIPDCSPALCTAPGALTARKDCLPFEEKQHEVASMWLERETKEALSGSVHPTAERPACGKRAVMPVRGDWDQMNFLPDDGCYYDLYTRDETRDCWKDAWIVHTGGSQMWAETVYLIRLLAARDQDGIDVSMDDVFVWQYHKNGPATSFNWPEIFDFVIDLETGKIIYK
jgi:hypothetical protein